MAIATDFVGAAADRTLLERLVPVFRLKIAPKGTDVDGVYEVEQIINHRPETVGPEALHIEYLVKWAGFDRQDSTWEPGATRSSKAPSTLLATIGQRDHRRSIDTDQHATIGPTAKERSASGQDTSTHCPPLACLTLRGAWGSDRWMAGLARLVWGLGYLQTVPVVYICR
jgi:hypothetical protein